MSAGDAVVESAVVGSGAAGSVPDVSSGVASSPTNLSLPRDYRAIMRLHRTISPDLPLLVVALEVEAAHLHVSELPILVTGAGKVNAAIAVTTTLASASPARVVNLAARVREHLLR
jgi:hypothetical protein